MLSHWDEFTGKHHNKLRERIKKGIPDSLRSRAWPKLIIPHYGTQDYHPTDVDKLLEGGNQVGYQTIEKDLARTMPNYPMFNNEKVFNSLRRVLYAYSNKDPELGYTQGMSAIAGLLLLYLDESTAYDCFETLMLDERYGLRHYFIQEFPRLKLLNKVWEEIMKERYPKVWKTFTKVNLESLYYTPSWFLTLFFNQKIAPILKFRIFDRFCEFGSKALISFGLVIVSRHKDDLINKPFEKVIMTMQHPFKRGSSEDSGKMDDWRYVLKKYDELWISDAKYKTYFQKAGVEYFN
ncbi:TBC domain containing protein [Trichomonas vaginalis G3]|uniref:TBC domain containing protein n=1 Tax=Trichomonas vaginalis (strain ATCC PRA-98 / G3) TaxID=412133 RepID=A2EC67_TRIV3|nr:regulation of vesicle fusion [Trichomonas vaginalis G3]EAY09744.1 TBC domain containing protein [Trichomonas vaginalis G3]KAI5550898.1 regulation of vesicle fusion [Trichomonas vaginalis G3]|eukprot:XP_001321967.1 TBC domain containing protein [Trichomonas vaginalis G3]